MSAVTVEKNLIERREKRAQSIAAMGLVNRVGDKFMVSTPSLRGKQSSYEVRRDDSGKIRCNCLEFEESVISDPAFRCEHILAVKHSLLAKNTEAVTKQTAAENKTSAENVSVTQNATESGENPVKEDGKKIEIEKSKIKDPKSKIVSSTSGEQKSATVSTDVSVKGQAESHIVESSPLANNGDKTMKQVNLRETEDFVTAEEANEYETPNNVMNFPHTLRQLRQNVDPQLVKQREGWRDRNGNTHYVDYVEWHTVADILDETAPNWSHTVKDIRQIGGIFTVTVAITIDGVTREGIGTGTADSELGIKKAEHDALKRAAVKFGIARDLYKRESDVIERDGAVPPTSPSNNGGGFPANPVAKSIGDLVTAKQLGMIRALAREKGIDAEEECSNVMNCRTDELSRKAGSSFIQHLQDFQADNGVIEAPLRRAS